MGNREYDPSQLNAKQLLYDFYTLSLFQGIKPELNTERTKDLVYNFKYAWNKLIPFLREHLLEKVMNSLFAEIWHYNYDSRDDIVREVVGIGSTQYDNRSVVARDIESKATRRNLGEFIVDRSNDFRQLRVNLPPNEPFDPLSWDKPSNEEFAEVCPIMEKLFRQDRWSGGYGGDLWAEGCDGWMKLYRHVNDATAYIDHIYDLQHNNGQLLDKNAEYKGVWLKNALDHKKYAKTTMSLSHNASAFVRDLARQLDFAVGKTTEEKNLPPAGRETSQHPATPWFGNLADIPSEADKPSEEALVKALEKKMEEMEKDALKTSSSISNYDNLNNIYMFIYNGMNLNTLREIKKVNNPPVGLNEIGEYLIILASSIVEEKAKNPNQQNTYKIEVWKNYFLKYAIKYTELMPITKKERGLHSSIDKRLLESVISKVSNIIGEFRKRGMKDSVDAKNLECVLDFLESGSKPVIMSGYPETSFTSISFKTLSTSIIQSIKDKTHQTDQFGRLCNKFLNIANSYVESIAKSIGVSVSQSVADQMAPFYMTPEDSTDEKKWKLQAMGEIASHGKVSPATLARLRKCQQDFR